MPSAPTRAKGDAQCEPSRYHLVSADASRRRPQRAPTRPGPVTGTPGDRYLRLRISSVSRSRLARELPRTHTPVRTSHRLSDERNRAYFPRSMPYHSAIVPPKCTRWNHGTQAAINRETLNVQASNMCNRLVRLLLLLVMRDRGSRHVYSSETSSTPKRLNRGRCKDVHLRE